KNNSNNKLGTVNNQGETNTNNSNINNTPNTNANNTPNTTTSPHNNPPQKHESAKAVGHNSNSKPKVKKQNTPLIKSTVYLQNITNNKNVKDKRIDSDKKYKFTLDNCNNESLHKFKDSLKGVFLDDFLKKFCSDDFKSFIESINNLKGTLDRKENINNFLDNLDLILKVLGIRLSSSQNPSLLKSAFEFLDTLEETLKSQNYEMNDIETNVLLTILIDKLTILNSSLKEQVLLLINKFINLIGQNKATLIIISTAIKRNAKIKSEVIELIIDMYMNTDIDIANKSYIKLFGRLLLTNDNNIKAKIIGLFKEIYAKIGTEIWNYLTDIPEKERKFLETNLIEMDNEEEEAEGEEDEEAEGEEVEEEEEVDETEASNQVVPQKKIENKKQNLNEDEEEEPKPADDTKAKNIIVISKQQLSKNNKASHSIEKKNNYTTNTNKNTSNTNTVPPNMRKIVVQQKSTNAPNNYGTANVSSNKPNQNTKGKIIITSVPSKKPNPPPENKNSTNAVQSQLNYAPSDGTLTDKNDLIKIINGLKEKDLSIKVNTIIIIHELICTNKYEENKTILIDNIDYIINTFIEALKVLFPDKTNLADIPIKFAKYLATVLCKISSNKELISNIKYETLFSLSEELLSNLLIENLSSIGDNKEGNIIFKSLNSTMLRILENVNSTHVIVALLEIVKIYRNNEEKAKLAGLAIKCLLKLNQNLETIINTIEVDKILLQIHLIITDLEKIYPDLIPKTQTEQITIKFAKNLINEIVKIKKRAILADYKKGLASREIQDKYILKWIKNYLNIMSQSENFETNETNEPISPKNESANEGSSTNVSAANTSSPGNNNPGGVMHVKRNSGLESGGLGKASSKTKATLPTGISNFKHTSGESANIKSFAEMRYKYNFMNKKKPAQKKK
ncbi:MAG: hypothetical protein MJ252_13015, partial [archaeon]|nr:hypothetical protein [archaeon]